MLISVGPTQTNLVSSATRHFSFEPQRTLLTRKDFNWNQFTFNSFESTFNWYFFWTSKNLLIRKECHWNQFAFNSFESTFNWFSFWTSKKSDKKGVPLKSIYFQFIWIYFQLMLLLNLKENLLIRKDFNWNQFTFNSFESTFNWFFFWTSKKSIDKKGFQLKSIYVQFIRIYFQLIFVLNIKEIYWEERQLQ